MLTYKIAINTFHEVLALVTDKTWIVERNKGFKLLKVERMKEIRAGNVVMVVMVVVLSLSEFRV